MALPGSGNIALGPRFGDSRSIMFEIRGNYTGAYSLRFANSESGKAATAKLKDYYGYQHIGDMYGEYTGFFAVGVPKIKRVTHGGSYEMDTSETFEYKPASAYTSENTKCVANDGSAIRVIDSVEAWVYRADKGSTSWAQVAYWASYTSQEYTAHDFTLYNYKWTLVAPP